MATITERYDRAAEDYARYWAPVLEGAARRLLDLVDGDAPPAPGSRLLDVGTGTGVLALEAARRWPGVLVTGLDASRGMLGVAEARAGGLPEETRARLGWLHGEADRIPLADGSVDVVVSSFVFQLVPDRPAALGEAWRVLRPAGRLWFVTWLDEADDFAPRDAYDEAVLDLGVDEPEEEPEDRAGDYGSAAAAAAQLRRARFADVRARAERLDYTWTLESYLAYKEHYDERALFASLDEAQRERLRGGARERLGRLDPTAFRWRSGIVYARGTKPGG